MVLALRKIVAAALCVLLLLSAPGIAHDASPVAPPLGGAADVVSFCVDPDWPPYESVTPEGQHVGIGGDLLRLAAARAGLDLRLVRTKDWEESIAQSKAGACTLLSFLNQTAKRDAWLLFTEPLFTDPNVIITHEEHSFVADLAGVSDETVVLPKGTSIEEQVRRDFPNLTVLLTDSEAEAFAMVSNRKADLTIRSMTVAVHTIKKEGWFNLKIAGHVPGYDNRLRIGVLKSAADLRDRLNQAIATITPQERALIANRHVAITVQTGLDYDLIQKIIFGFTLVLLTSLFWIAKLYRLNRELEVQSQTDSLTGLANRASLNHRFAKEIERAKRHKRPLSVIMCDLDHFKRVNDRLGHLAGDRMLRDFATLARTGTRSIDLVARWGGEEFLILCPETDAESALILARRLCETVRGHAFATGWPHSVSVGVASLRPDDTVDSLLVRADQALYQAKEEGRDRACLEIPLALPVPARTPAL